MKEFYTIIMILALFSLTSCGFSELPTLFLNEKNETNDTQSTKVVTGQVLSCYGNELTLQLAEQGGNNVQLRPDAATDKMKDYDIENRPDNAQGARPMENGTMPNRVEGESADKENMREMGGMMGSGGESGKMNGDGSKMPSTSGEMAGMNGNGDFSENITLSEEIKVYQIPVNTPVTQYNTELTFSQIAEEMFVSISLDENDTILFVSILG